MTKQPFLYILIICISFLVGLIVGARLMKSEFMISDRCLDLGGSWKEDNKTCQF